MKGLYVAVRREEYWAIPGELNRQPHMFTCSAKEERNWITGWRARLILRLAGFPPECHPKGRES